jgi:hypothetical protein
MGMKIAARGSEPDFWRRLTCGARLLGPRALNRSRNITCGTQVWLNVPLALRTNLDADIDLWTTRPGAWQFGLRSTPSQRH